MPPAAITAEMPEPPPYPSPISSRFSKLRGVKWRIDLGILPSSLSSSIDDLRRVSADHRRRYAALRRHLLVDPQVTKFSDDSPDLVVDNPLSQNPDSTWGRFFRNAELEQMVDKDLSRLYPEHGSYFQTSGCQVLLRRILLLWCLRHPECGYRQGMHELLAPLLYVLHADILHFNEVRKLYEEHFVDKFDEVLLPESLDFNFKIYANTVDSDNGSREQIRKSTSLSDLDANVQVIVQLSDPYGAEGELGIVLSEKFLEHDAYCMFDALMNGAGGAVAMAKFFSHPPASGTQTGLPPVIEASLALYHLLSIVDSSLYNHLVELSVEPQYFALRWLRVLFGREFSLEDLLLIWDEIFSFDNSQHVTTPANDPGVFNSPRGAFICAMAVSMILSMRSSLLATEYTTSCLQRLLNFPEDVDLEKLIGKAKSLVPLAQAANVPSFSAPLIGQGYQSKQSTIKGHAHSLSFDSSAPVLPVIVPERYWEEKWRVAQEEQESKKEIAAKLASPLKRSWTEKIKSRLTRSESDPSSSIREARHKDKRSVRRSLLEDLSQQLNLGEDSEETGHDDKLACLLDPPCVEYDAVVQDARDENATCIDKKCSGLSTASEEHSPAFSEPSSPAENDSEKSSIISNLSHDNLVGGTHDAAFFQLATEEYHSTEEESSLPLSVAPDEYGYGPSVSDNSSKELSPTGSKERKTLSGKFQWFWKFGKLSFGEGTSNSNPEVEDVKPADGGTQKPGSSVDEANSGHVNIKSDGCDQKLLCTLRNLGQSMLENIQVIESAFQQEKSPPGSLDQLSKHALVEKGQVTAITALKELRKISNILQEM